MTRFAKASVEERALIPNVMQPSTKNGIKRVEMENKRVIHALIINTRYKQQSSSREEPPYTMYCLPNTRKYAMPSQMKNISFLYIGDKGVQ